MRQLNFKQYSFRFKNRENKPLIFDVVRKKFIVLTPEEWVRQNTIHYLIKELKIPLSLINVEKQFKLHGTTKRYDIVTFNPDVSIHLVVECKADSINISQDTFDQIARYNLALQSTFLMVTNGIDHYYCRMDLQNQRYSFLEILPEYQK